LAPGRNRDEDEDEFEFDWGTKTIVRVKRKDLENIWISFVRFSSSAIVPPIELVLVLIVSVSSPGWRKGRLSSTDNWQLRTDN
jgi:hypothetical protein